MKKIKKLKLLKSHKGHPKMQDRFQEEKESRWFGRTREKGQPLTTKFTRGDRFGKRWFPY